MTIKDENRMAVFYRSKLPSGVGPGLHALFFPCPHDERRRIPQEEPAGRKKRLRNRAILDF